MTELEIPERAVDAFAEAADDSDEYAGLRIFAAIIIATKLRQLADDWDAGRPVTRARLRAEADELDPEGASR
jgi:hypothetical protein